MIELSIIITFAFLNRLCGGGWFADKLPSRVLFWVAPIIGGIACCVLPWRDGVLFGAAYLVWRWLSWGHWFDLGRKPPLVRAKTQFEQIIESMSFGSDHVALFWRMCIGSPLLAYFGWVYALIFPFACVAIYEVAWRIWPDTDDDDDNTDEVSPFINYWNFVLNTNTNTGYREIDSKQAEDFLWKNLMKDKKFTDFLYFFAFKK